MQITDAVTVITGAASGIGRASALAFAREGADIIAADLDAEGTKRIAAEIEELGRRALALTVDVGRREDMERLVDESIAWQGHCDIFFSNAGVGVTGPPDRIPLEDWEWVMNVNLWSHIWAIRRILPHMLERGSGHLIHTASSAGIIGFPTLAPYVVTKFGVVGLAESLAIHCHGTGVGVSVICPLGVATNISERTRATFDAELDEASETRMRELMHTFLHQIGIPPEEVAERTLDAVRGGRLYVFPNPELRDILDTKWRDPDAWVAQWKTVAEAQRQAFEAAIGPEAPA